MVLVYTNLHLSGGHINPAVTLCLVLLRKVSVFRCFFYFLSQFLGSMVGAALVLACTTGLVGTDLIPENPEFGTVLNPPFNLGSTVLNPALNAGNGFLLEFSGTFLLCIVVVQTAVDGRSPARPYLTPLAVGFTVFVVHLSLVPFTGCGINPARTFGPAIVTCMVSSQACGDVIDATWWIYWIGPFTASAIAALVTQFLYEGPRHQTFIPLVGSTNIDLEAVAN